MFNKIAEFFKTKENSAIIKNTSVQDHYEAAALKIIAEIKKLKLRHVTARENVSKFTQIADQMQPILSRIKGLRLRLIPLENYSTSPFRVFRRKDEKELIY